MVKKKRRKRRKFKKNPIEMIVEVVILIVLVPTFFKLSLLVGFGYLFAIFVSVYNGNLFRKKYIARFIVFGSVMTYIAGLILIYGYKQDDWITFVIIIIVGILVWLKGRKWKRGKK